MDAYRAILLLLILYPFYIQLSLNFKLIFLANIQVGLVSPTPSMNLKKKSYLREIHTNDSFMLPNSLHIPQTFLQLHTST